MYCAKRCANKRGFCAYRARSLRRFFCISSSRAAPARPLSSCAATKPIRKSSGEQLLSDIRETFAGKSAGRPSSDELIANLVRFEARPWAGPWERPDAAHGGRLAALLRLFGSMTAGQGYHRRASKMRFSDNPFPSSKRHIATSGHFCGLQNATDGKGGVSKHEIASVLPVCGGVAFAQA